MWTNDQKVELPGSGQGGELQIREFSRSRSLRFGSIIISTPPPHPSNPNINRPPEPVNWHKIGVCFYVYFSGSVNCISQILKTVTLRINCPPKPVKLQNCIPFQIQSICTAPWFNWHASFSVCIIFCPIFEAGVKSLRSESQRTPHRTNGLMVPQKYTFVLLLSYRDLDFSNHWHGIEIGFGVWITTNLAKTLLLCEKS